MCVTRGRRTSTGQQSTAGRAGPAHRRQRLHTLPAWRAGGWPLLGHLCTHLQYSTQDDPHHLHPIHTPRIRTSMPRPPRPQPNSPARLPQSPRHAGQNASEPTKGKEELANVRSAANFKIVQRNDPALAEILDTTAYAVIYHWGDGKWEKQKQEGSLFVIRR